MSSTSRARAAVFLDRDGVLNELVEREGRLVSPRRVADFRIVADAAQSIARLRANDLAIFVVTNQPDLARGLMPETESDQMMALLRESVPIDDAQVCGHDDMEQCYCRKPQPGMLLSLAERWSVDLERSFMIGDSRKDMEAGRRAGCFTVLIGCGEGAEVADATAGSLSEAVQLVISRLN